MQHKALFMWFLLAGFLDLFFVNYTRGNEERKLRDQMVDGLSASICLSQTDLKVGDELVVNLNFENTSERPCYFYLPTAYLALDLLIANQHGEQVKKIITVKYRLGPPEQNFRLLNPGEQLDFKLDARVKLSRNDDILTDTIKEPVVISFFDVDHVISSAGSFGISYHYLAADLGNTVEFVSKLAKQLAFEDVWLRPLSSNTVAFTVRFPTFGELNAHLDLLATGTQQEKTQTIKFLGANLERRCTPYLMEFLKGTDRELSKLAVDTLIEIGDKAVIPQLLILYDRQTNLRCINLSEVLRIIITLEDSLERKRDLLTKIIDSETSLLAKQNAVSHFESLCLQSGDPNDLAYLLKIANSNEAELRVAVARALGGVYQVLPQKLHAQIVDRLTDFALNDPNPSVRSIAIQNLSIIEPFAGNDLKTTLVPLFLQAMKDSDTCVRKMAIQSLGLSADRTTIPVLEAFMEQTGNKWEIEATQKAIHQITVRHPLKPTER